MKAMTVCKADSSCLDRPHASGCSMGQVEAGVSAPTVCGRCCNGVSIQISDNWISHNWDWRISEISDSLEAPNREWRAVGAL